MRAQIIALISLLATPATAQSLNVLTDLPLTASLVQQVAGDLVEVAPLLDQGADPHHFQLRPSQARALQGTDLLVWIGPELTPSLARAAEQLESPHQIALLHEPSTKLQDFAASEGHEGHDHDHAAGGTDAHLDPHAWLDPDNALAWLDVIAAKFAELDPANAETYRANAESAKGRLAETDAALKQMLAPAQGKTFVTFHDAYGYFTRHYGLQDAIAVSLGDATTPSAARIRDVQARIKASDAVCAFPEANQSRAAIEAVSVGTTLRIGEPLSPEGTDIDTSPDTYKDILEATGRRIAECFTGNP
ncbi:zinc ABC transporter substrate-binding protein [Paracoccus aurantiacus]|uniref:High-affinity zinc uptake system protein ZnuA n=1 Tax=Paracoccus aurantiacus TaxID=2599412 RepID=A0A5C6S221_9RHOB|nr:zinc ABC transporter substrate-binding protein [Paracoccus aurantiacus]TXB68495.1 zinc ABC transporter substrate-binding protein [Paracoccus aurantiacus]